MFTKEEVARYAAVLDQVAMEYEISVTPLFREDYLREFTELFRIRSRGQKLVPACIEKAAEVRAMLDKAGVEAIVEVDGGVNLQTAPKLVAAGADMLVAGSALYGAADARAFIEQVKETAR